jgi:hypothetical protein
MHLECTGDGSTEVETKLWISSSNLKLTGGDTLKVTSGGQSQLLIEEENLFNVVRHVATLSLDDPDMPVTISFERPNHVDALDSQVALPEYVEIQNPQPGDTFSYQENIRIDWMPSGVSQNLDVHIAKSCESGGTPTSATQYRYTSDIGTASYPVQDLLTQEERDAGATCDVTITLTREVSGTVSSEFESGTIIAQRIASVTVEIVP